MLINASLNNAINIIFLISHLLSARRAASCARIGLFVRIVGN